MWFAFLDVEVYGQEVNSIRSWKLELEDCFLTNVMSRL